MRVRVRSILEALFRRSSLEAGMDVELRAHIDIYTEDLIRSGVARAEAERRSRVAFGRIEAVKEDCREARGLRWPNELRQDLRYAFRSLRKAPGFAAAAVLSLVLGIGANAAIFSVINAALIRPLPYAEPGRLFAVYENRTSRGAGFGSFANANFVDLRASAPSFEDMAAHLSTRLTLTSAGEAEQLSGRLVTGNMFAVLGVSAHRGRTLIPEDGMPGKPRVILLSYALWQRKFQADPAIVGRALNLDGNSYTVTGIMPDTFRFPGAQDEFWAPLRLDAKDQQQRSNHNLACIARLKRSADPRQARSEISFIARRLQREYPDTNAGIDFALLPLHESLTRAVRGGLIVLLAAVGLMLLIACANVGNLILARSTARRRELAIRVALGVGRWRLVRQMLTESLCLALLGGATALALCLAITNTLRTSLPPALTPAGEIRVDAGVLCFGLLAAVTAGLLSGLAPALLVAGGKMHLWLAGSSRSATGSGAEVRTRSALVAAEVSLTLMLLIGAGLLLRSFVRLMDVDPGFKPANVLAVRFTLPQFLYPAPGNRMSFYQRLLERMEATPGVQSAALTTCSPLTNEGGSSWFVRDGRPTTHPEELIANNRLVSENYFDSLRIPLREGRTFSRNDGADAPPVAVINESMARRFWPGESPVGKRFQFVNKPWVQIIGVVGDIHQTALDLDPAAEIYRPITQDTQAWLAPRALLIRTRGEPAAFGPLVRQQFQALDSGVPIFRLDSMEALLEKTVASRRLQVWLVGAFGLVSLLLASIGIYGVVAYVVAQRGQEIGLRMALGATRGNVVAMMLRKGLSPVLIGLLIGVVLAPALGGLLSSQLYHVTATDTLTFATAPLVLLLIAVCAAYFPSRRAARIDPMLALRQN